MVKQILKHGVNHYYVYDRSGELVLRLTDAAQAERLDNYLWQCEMAKKELEEHKLDRIRKAGL